MALTDKQKLRKLRQKADKWQRQQRVEYDRLTGKTDPSRATGANPNSLGPKQKWQDWVQNEGNLFPDPSGRESKTLFHKQHGFSFHKGNRSDANFREFMDFKGGNPFLKKIKGMRKGGQVQADPVPTAGLEAIADQENPLQQFLRDAQYKSDQREADDRQRDRTLEGMRRGGTRAQAALDQDLFDRRKNIRADFAGIGMDMQSGNQAQEGRAIFNNKLLQGDLDDRLDDRLISRDVDLTERIEGFRERPTYQGPDFNQMMQLAQLSGRGADGGGFRELENRVERNRSVPQIATQGGRVQAGGPIAGGYVNYGSGGYGNIFGGINQQIAQGNQQYWQLAGSARRQEDRRRARS